MKIVTVIPLKKGNFKEELTYFTAKEVPDGSIVTVSLRNKKILGLAVSSEEVSDSKSDIKSMSFNLKKIIDIKEKSIFSEKFLRSAFETGRYFAAKKNDSVTVLIPSVLREEYDQISKEKTFPTELGNMAENIKSEKLVLQAPLEERISLYKTMVRESFARKKSIFIVLPTEYDIENFAKFLSKGIENFIFTISSGLTAKKSLERINQMLECPHPVLILATAPYLSVPRGDIETIILEHESSNAYKMIQKPFLDMRIFVETFAQNTSTRLILADSFLRFETIEKERSGGLISLRPLLFRINSQKKMEIADRNTEKEKRFSIFEKSTESEIKEYVSNKKNVLIFSLRKGLATMTICRDCNEAVMCEDCSAPLVLHKSQDDKKRIFACNRCKKEADPGTLCKNCGSWNLAPIGIGTDTVFEEVEKLFPKKTGVKVFKIDKDSAKTAKEARKIIKEFEETPGSVLVGTEMVFYYLTEKVRLSVVASFDSLWSVPSFRMSERVVQLMSSLLSSTEEKLIVQTKNPNDPALSAIKAENLAFFVREELEDRKNLGYPPFKRFIKITHSGDKSDTVKVRSFLERMFEDYNPQVFSGFIAKQKGKYMTNALIRLEPSKWPLPGTPSSAIDDVIFSKVSSLPSEFEISIDPEDLL